MGSPSVLVGVLLLVISSTDGMTTPSLYATTNPAVPGQVFTLVCVWNITDINETIRPNATDIYWTRKGTDSVTDTQYVFYSDTCELNKIHNRSYTRQVSVRYGLLYQSLIFANITDLDIGDIWFCAFRESNMSNHVEVKNKVGTVGENVHMSGSSDVVYTGSAITLRCTNMFNTSYFPMTWFIDGVKYILDENCSIHIDRSKPDNLNIVNRTLTNCSQVGSPTLTLTNVSHTDHNGTWVCSILQNVSNTYRVIVLDPPGLGNIQIVQVTDVATLYSDFSLICSWERSDCDNIAYVRWISEIKCIESNYTTCVVEKYHIHTLNMVISTGYRHQTLTFVNVTQELNGSDWLCISDSGSVSSKIIVDEQNNVTLKLLSPTTWYGSTFTLICSYDHEPDTFTWTSHWHRSGTLQFSLSENSCNPPSSTCMTRCTRYQHVVTLLNVSSEDIGSWPDGVALHTTEAEIIMTETATIETPITETTITETHITETPITETATTETPITETATIETPITETATTETPITETATIETPITETATTETPITETATIETPITEKATIETPITETPITETTITETPTTLICSTKCEDENYVFHWNISSGNISEMEYNNCTSTCTQKVTFDVEGIDSHYVNCKVINNRTRKEDSAVIKLNIELKPNQDHVTTSDHVTTQPSAVVSDLKNIYIGAGSTVGVLLIVVCIVVIVCCKRKSTGSDKVMMDNVLYTSARTETLQDSQVKLVMQDNELYGYGASEWTGNNPVMMENVLYTSAEGEISKSHEQLEMEDNVLYGYGDPESTHIGNNAGMVDNVLYTSTEAENAKSREKLVMEEYLLYEYGGPQSSHNQHIPVMEENVLYESSGGRN